METAPPCPGTARPREIRLDPEGCRFTAKGTASILQAAAQAGWRLPSSCRNGTCRACLCRLRSGRVSYLVEWPGVSAEERAEGWILPCVAVAENDLVIEVEGLKPLLG